MQNFSPQRGPSDPSDPPGPAGTSGRPGPLARPGPSEAVARIPGALVFVLVVVAVHAVGTALGGWVVLDENYSKQEHGQDLILPMDMAWFVALFCWGLAALQAACVALSGRRRPWTRAVLAACLALVACSTLIGFLGSLLSGAPSLPVLLVFGIDAAALWVLLGGTAHRWFSVRGPAPTTPRG
ncbi:hypothetical protein [Streptomyces sp. rh34]|uniref:hypothetical protein n=1 Tax=Streptomyces sp. rh34 TaxID=2034272 RepID=UPI00117DE391|nr:hypothetical protein [Streptomyces sp. rh34]